MFVHLNNTIAGMCTIRASQLSERVICGEFYAHVNDNTRAVTSNVAVNRWLAVRLDFVAVAFSQITIFGCILLKGKLN